MTTKTEIVQDIADLLGVVAPPMSTGSTEPKQIFVLINEVLGLGLDPKLDKPGLARGIVEAAGFTWGADHESRGATVTLMGLRAVANAVHYLTAR